MFQTRLVQIRHECRRLFGLLLSKIHLHCVKFASTDGIDIVRKRRRFFAHVMIPPGNLFLKFIGSPICVLPTTEWLQWEQSIDEAMRQNMLIPPSTDVGVVSRVLICRRLPGATLRQVLIDDNYSLEQKLDAIRWSLVALTGLHRIVADWGHELRQLISHGDATVNNVIIDVDHKTACWIDFDTRHRPGVSETNRFADDLRTLIYSAAVHLPVSDYPELARILMVTQIDDATIGSFRQKRNHEWIHLTSAQLAQAPLTWLSAVELRAALAAIDR